MIRLLTFGLAVAAVCSAQVTGEFRLPKSTVTVGEPVILEFITKNESAKTVEVATGDAFNFCSDYTFKQISPEPKPYCDSRDFAGSCLGSGWNIEPHEPRTERLPLDHWVKFDKPGIYLINATRKIKWGVPGDTLGNNPLNHVAIQQQLQVEVKPRDEAEIAAAANALVGRFHSSDTYEQMDAQRIIFDSAPLPLEKFIIDSSKQPALADVAVAALGKLNTLASRSRLAEISVQGSDYQRQKAIELLGESTDEIYAPLLLSLANKTSTPTYDKGLALQRYAKLLGASALPELTRALATSDKDLKRYTIWALKDTRSAEAVPVLIQMLRDPEQAAYARIDLETFTKKTGPQDARRWAMCGRPTAITKSMLRKTAQRLRPFHNLVGTDRYFLSYHRS